MTESDLLAIIEQERQNAAGTDDQQSQDRAKMLAYYMGEAKYELAPPDVEGRSQVVSKDLMDTVEWIMPSLMRMFAGQDDVIQFLPESEGEEQQVDDANEYIGYLFYRRNPGFRILHDAFKNCLIQRSAFAKVYCDTQWDQRVERYHGIDQFDLQALQSDPDVEITELSEYEAAMMPGPDGQPMEVNPATFDVICQRKHSRLNYKVDGVPPERLRFNRDATSLETARFVEHCERKAISDLRSLGYDPEKLDRLPSNDDSYQTQYEEDERGYYDDSTNSLTRAARVRLDEALREVDVYDTYVRVDFDGDGIAEYRHVISAGDQVFVNEIADDHEFAAFTPVLMPYKAIGLGMWDLVEDLQRIRTVLTRQMLDNAYLANNPVTTIVEGQVNLDDLLNRRAGGVRRVKDLNSIREEGTPFIGGQCLTLLDAFGQQRDKRTGVTEFNQGLGADALSKSAIGSEGVADLMSAAMQRVELIARVLAETGMARVWQLLLKKAVQYADRPAQVKINGRWLRVDPREWRNRYDMEINIGTGTANKQQQVANLTLIAQAQDKLFPLGMVSKENIYTTATRMVRALGYRNADQFFQSPENQPPQQEGPPPEVQAEMAKQQGAMQLEQLRQQGALQLAQIQAQTQMHLKQVEAQTQIEVENAKQAAQAEQASQEQALQAQRDELRLQNDKELAMFQARLDAETEIRKAMIAHQQAVDTADIQAEASVLGPYRGESNAPEIG